MKGWKREEETREGGTVRKNKQFVEHFYGAGSISYISFLSAEGSGRKFVLQNLEFLDRGNRVCAQEAPGNFVFVFSSKQWKEWKGMGRGGAFYGDGKGIVAIVIVATGFLGRALVGGRKAVDIPFLLF